MDDTHKDTLETVEKCLSFYTDQLTQRRRFLNETITSKQMLLVLNPNSDVSDLLEIEKLLHFNSLLNIALIELLVIMKHLMLSTQEWEKAYFLKHSYLIVHETIEKYDGHNKDLYQLTVKYTDLGSEYKRLSALLKQFKKNYDYPDAFCAIRNAIAAHIDQNVGIYYDAVAALDGSKVLAIINTFTQILMDLLAFSANIAILEKKRVVDHFRVTDEPITDLKPKIEQFFLYARKRGYFK